MLDTEGFISETNATNIFIVKNKCLFTPSADSCLPGITRGVVIGLAKDDGIPVAEKRLSQSEMYSADEIFVTGTMGEITPVLEVDGRVIGNGETGPVTLKMQELFAFKTSTEGDHIPL